jgi:nitrate reductase NapE component
MSMLARKLVALFAMVLLAGAVMAVADVRDWSALMAYLVLAAVAVPVIAVAAVYAEGLWPRPRERQRN